MAKGVSVVSSRPLTPGDFYKDTTDAHLVHLAVRPGLKLATLNMALLAKPWASRLAFNPILESP